MIFGYGKPASLLRFFLIAIVWILCSASSCTTTLRNEQLESVAKDWALVIRASQVIPVYPLSEDLQPGDVLLVNTPVEDQVALYKQKGFLPLDQHLVRLYSDGFQRFYNSRYGLTDSTIPPTQWQRKPEDGSSEHNWKMAPRAAFPTYQFAVSTGAGLNLAIPIHGVPFALGLMNSGRANGTVTISDAYTFGLDNMQLAAAVKDWAAGARVFLSHYAPPKSLSAPAKQRSHFLRVISRVYVTGQVSVTVNNDEALSGQMSGGADKPVELLGIKQGATEQNYSSAIEVLNKIASEKLPGGKVKIASASSRSITLSEEFERPLVIGYVGFDMPILEGGRLGFPISTLAQLNAEKMVATRDTLDSVTPYRLAALQHVYNGLKESADPKASLIRTELDRHAEQLPSTYSFSLLEFSRDCTLKDADETIHLGNAVQREKFQDVLDYLGNAEKTMVTLDKYLKCPHVKQEEATARERERQAAKAAYNNVFGLVKSDPALTEATELFLFDR